MKLIIYIFLLQTFLFSDIIQNYLKQHQELHTTLKDFNKTFKTFKQAYHESLIEYKADLKNFWPKTETTSAHIWLQYWDNYKAKTVIDYHKAQLRFAVYANHEKEAFLKILALYEKITKHSVLDANKQDIIENKVANKLNLTNDTLYNNEMLLSPLISSQEQTLIKDKILEQELTQIPRENNVSIFISKVNLPKNAILQKANIYKPIIEKLSQDTNISEELIYSIIHAKSSFNTLARNNIPAFGLMQITPHNIGIKSYYAIYGKKKILYSRYLYNPKNNIELGVAYLRSLYHKKLTHIQNPANRLQCTIVAYDIGVENMSKVFIESNDTQNASDIINNLTPVQIYKKFMKKLQNKKTKKFLFNVNRHLQFYTKHLLDSQTKLTQ